MTESILQIISQRTVSYNSYVPEASVFRQRYRIEHKAQMYWIISMTRLYECVCVRYNFAYRNHTQRVHIFSPNIYVLNLKCQKQKHKIESMRNCIHIQNDIQSTHFKLHVSQKLNLSFLTAGVCI